MAAAVCLMDELEFDTKEAHQLELDDLELVECHTSEVELDLYSKAGADRLGLSGEEFESFQMEGNNSKQTCGRGAAVGEPLESVIMRDSEDSVLDSIIALELEDDGDDGAASFSTDALYEDILWEAADVEVSLRGLPVQDNDGLNRTSRSSSLDSFDQQTSTLLCPEDLSNVFTNSAFDVKSLEVSSDVKHSQSYERPASISKEAENLCQNENNLAPVLPKPIRSKCETSAPKPAKKAKIDALQVEDRIQEEDAKLAYERYLERRAKVLKWLEKRPRRVFSKKAQSGRTAKGKVAQKRKRNHLGRFL